MADPHGPGSGQTGRGQRSFEVARVATVDGVEPDDDVEVDGPSTLELGHPDKRDPELLFQLPLVEVEDFGGSSDIRVAGQGGR